MFPAPIVMSMSPGHSPSSNAEITWSSESQDLADWPKPRICSASSAASPSGSEVAASRAANTGAISTWSACEKLAAKSAMNAFVRDTWCG